MNQLIKLIFFQFQVYMNSQVAPTGLIECPSIPFYKQVAPTGHSRQVKEIDIKQLKIRIKNKSSTKEQAV